MTFLRKWQNKPQTEKIFAENISDRESRLNKELLYFNNNKISNSSSKYFDQKIGSDPLPKKINGWQLYT